MANVFGECMIRVARVDRDHERWRWNTRWSIGPRFGYWCWCRRWRPRRSRLVFIPQCPSRWEVGEVNCCTPVHLIMRNVNSSSFPAASEQNVYVNMNVFQTDEARS